MTGIAEIGYYACEVFNQDIYRVVIRGIQAGDYSGRAAERVSKSQKSMQSLLFFTKKGIRSRFYSGKFQLHGKTLTSCESTAQASKFPLFIL